jgi:hypothetical protein
MKNHSSACLSKGSFLKGEDIAWQAENYGIALDGMSRSSACRHRSLYNRTLPEDIRQPGISDYAAHAPVAM